jgi:hypothetical protein
MYHEMEQFCSKWKFVHVTGIQAVSLPSESLCQPLTSKVQIVNAGIF